MDETYDPEALANSMIQTIRDRWEANKRGELPEWDMPTPGSFEAEYWFTMDAFQKAAERVMTAVAAVGSPMTRLRPPETS